jgi:cytoskeletal protein RodZ
MQYPALSRILGVMPRRLVLVLAWLGATVLAVGVASAAVGTVRNQVTDRPQTTDPFFAAAPIADSSTTTLATTSTLVTTTAPTTTLPTTTTTIAETSTTQPSTVTTTTRPTTTTTVAPTTTAPPKPVTSTYDLVGGSVTISAVNPNVSLVGAVPNSGFTVKVENAGPNEVKVEFRSESRESEFSAKWDGGELRIRTDDHEDD